MFVETARVLGIVNASAGDVELAREVNVDVHPRDAQDRYVYCPRKGPNLELLRRNGPLN